jgi:Kef-type K+ transport system membrane component KefB
MELNTLLVLAFIFFVTSINKIISPKFKTPEVTGYVILGVLLSALVSPLIGKEHFDKILDSVEIVSSIALAIIGFSIGVELKISTLKKLGISIFYIVIFETGFTFLVVFLAVKLLGYEIYTALLLGAVAAATAPGATVAVIRQYKAKGNLTSAILAVVGIDDAAALMIYVIASSFAKSFISGKHVEVLSVIISVIISISLAIIIGLLCGFIYSYLMKKIRNNDLIEVVLIGFIFLVLGLSEELHISELLAIMTFGATIANLSQVTTKKSETIVEKFNLVFLAMFFIFGGAHLDLGVINSVLVIGIAFFFMRSFGKIVGATLGATLGRAPKNIRNNIGFTLLPQVGVALALAIAIKKEFTGVMTHNFDLGTFVFNILLFTTLITEVVGPILTKKALIRVNEIKE